MRQNIEGTVGDGKIFITPLEEYVLLYKSVLHKKRASFWRPVFDPIVFIMVIPF